MQPINLERICAPTAVCLHVAAAFYLISLIEEEIPQIHIQY